MSTHYAYHILWSAEYNEYVGLCAGFQSLSWLVRGPDRALAGIRRIVHDSIKDMRAAGESLPEPVDDRAESLWYEYRPKSTVRPYFVPPRKA